ncbi:MAG: ATP-binding protein [Gemmatimonadaceae bacterium]
MAIPTSLPTDWERLGFRQDPFYVRPLPVAALSSDLFVGRESDRHRLQSFLSNYVSGKTMVQGPTGVGKTSLVNVVQYELYAAATRFPLFEIVETPENATRESFLLQVISAAVSSLSQAFGRTDLEADEEFRTAQDAVTQTLRTGTTLGLSGGLAGGILGASVNQTTTAIPPLAPTVTALINLLRGLVAVAERRGFAGVIVPVNNLDVLPVAVVVQFLSMIRDVCDAVDGVHWVFIGGPHLFNILEGSARRISESFTSNPISLEALTWNDVEQALERRRRAFAIEPETPLPISMDIARLVYEASGGELRFTFVRLSRTVLEFSIRYPSERSVPDGIALMLLQEWARGQLARHPLTGREQDLLQYLVEHGTIRSRDYTAAGFTTAQHLSSLLRSLEKKEYVRIVAEQGVAREYGLTGSALLSLVGRGGELPRLSRSKLVVDTK